VTNTGERHSAAGVIATSTHGRSPADLWTGQYDLLICVSGWDQRAVAITEVATLAADRALLVLFDEKDSQGLRDRHDAQLQHFAQRAAASVDVLTGGATAVQDVWDAILAKVRECYFERGRPITVIFSASASPRYHTLALIGVGVGSGYIRKLRIAYSDGVYPEGSDDMVEVAFTGGTAAVLPIPGLEGYTEPEKRRFFLVSLGFEGWRSMRAVTRADPDRVCVLLGDPGSNPEYVARTLRDNAPLFEEFGISPATIIRAPASDAVATWRTLAEQKVERPDLENTSYLCTGTKAHSIGLALRAVQLGSPTVLYSLPEEHRVVPIRIGQLHWRFDISSTATPAANLA
jgi:hypothetical protein